MSILTYFAFEQAQPEPGCKYTKTVIIQGNIAGADIKCGPAYYSRQPYVYIPVALVLIVLIGVIFLHWRKKIK